MFDKLLGKEKKNEDILSIPSRKNPLPENSKLCKMSQKSVVEIVYDSQKYITLLLEKIEKAKEQFDILGEKIQLLEQKNQIINKEMHHINNEHEQLSIKFDNSQKVMEVMINEQQKILSDENSFIIEQNITQSKAKSIEKILCLYRDRVILCKKIQSQNRSLKQKYQAIESQYETLKGLSNEKQNSVNELKSNQSNKEAVIFNQSDVATMTSQEEIENCHIGVAMKNQVMDSSRDNRKQLERIQILQCRIEEKKSEMVELKERMLEKINQLEEKLILKSNELEESKKKNEENNLQQEKLIMKLSKQISECTEGEDDMQQQLKMLKSENQSLHQSKMKLQTEYDRIKNVQQRTIEEKKQILKIHQNNVENLNEAYNQIKEKEKEQNQLIEQLKIQKSNMQLKYQVYEGQMEALTNEIDKLKNQGNQQRQNIQHLHQNLQTKQESLIQKIKSIEAYKEDEQIKQHHYECELNQQRIKNNNMCRTISQLQIQKKEYKVSVDKMYEEAMNKNKKCKQMEIKLKEYKSMIQLLRLQKKQLQKNAEKIEKKTKAEEENDKNEEDTIEPEIEQIIRRTNSNKDNANQIACLEEHNRVLREENHKLIQTVAEQQGQIEELGVEAKNMREKRQQTIKQIYKINQEQKQKTQVLTNNQQNQKIAMKALKGFKILLQHLQQLYKNYIGIFENRMKEEGVKLIENNLNNLRTECMEMRDIIQDYL